MLREFLQILNAKYLILKLKIKLEIETMMGNFIKTAFSTILTSAITTMVINKFEIDFDNTIILLLAYLLLLWLVSFFSFNFMFTRKRDRIEILIFILVLIKKISKVICYILFLVVVSENKS